MSDSPTVDLMGRPISDNTTANTTHEFLESEAPFGDEFEAPPLPEGSEYYTGIPPLQESTKHYEPTDPLVLHTLNLHKTYKQATRELADLRKQLDSERKSWEAQQKPVVDMYQKYKSELPAEEPKIDDWDAESIKKYVDYQNKRHVVDTYASVAQQAEIQRWAAFKSSHEEFKHDDFKVSLHAYLEANPQKDYEDAFPIVAYHWRVAREKAHVQQPETQQVQAAHNSYLAGKNRDFQSREAASVISSGTRATLRPDYSKAKTLADTFRITEQFEKQTGRQATLEDLPDFKY